jgi:hypothetical protein
LTGSHLSPETVLDIASHLTLEDGAFLIGGQALNLWAEYYSKAQELAEYRPYTSKDIDYFGSRAAAQKLADQLGGQVTVPDPDDHTPHTAVVKAEIDGATILIDFLGGVQGVRPKELEKGVVEILLPYTREGVSGRLSLPVMHPLHCLQSRIANLAVLGRTDSTAQRQAEAAPIIVREYIDEALRDGDHREATRTLQDLFHFLKRDLTGRKAYRLVNRDPLEIMRVFENDSRIDSRFREKLLKPAIQQIEAKRSILGQILARISNRRTPAAD